MMHSGGRNLKSDAGNVASDDRYSVACEGDGGSRTLICPHCEDTFDLKLNRSIRTLVRHFLSLPFAACGEPTCANHRRNAFEHPPSGRGDEFESLPDWFIHEMAKWPKNLQRLAK